MQFLPRRLIGFSLLAALTLAGPLTGLAQNRLPTPLSGALNGEAAIQELSTQLPAVAVAHGLQPHALAALFRSQAGLHVDRQGALLFICEAPAASPLAVAVTETKAGIAAALGSGDGDPFRLHS